MPPPLFSVCVPSRDRLDTVKKTIGSVLSQSFEDFELLVADNSSVGKGQLAAWANRGGGQDPRLTVFETDRDLDMDQNWEFISSKATGEYVIFIADRWLMRPGTLFALAKIVAETSPDLFYWPGQKFGQLEQLIGDRGSPGPLPCVIEDADQVLSSFLQFTGYVEKNVYGQPIPRALNSGYRRSLAERAREIWGELFRPISPDYTSAAALLLLAEKCIRIDEMLYVPIGKKSNFSDSTIIGLRAYLDKHPGCNNWRGLELDTVFLTVLTDLERTFACYAGGENWIAQFNVENALKCVIWEFHFKEFNGSLHDTKQMRKQVMDFAKEQGLPAEAIARIEKFDVENRHKHVNLRRWLRRMGIYDQARNLNNRIRYANRESVRTTLADVDLLSDRDISY